MKSIVGVVILITLAAGAAHGQETSLPDVRPLPLLDPIEQEVSEQKARLYVVELKHGEALRVDLVEKGVDCVVSILSLMDGNLVTESVVNFGIGFERETVTYLPRKAGQHLVMVVAQEGRAGAYSLIGKIHPVTGKMERLRSQAVQYLVENKRLWSSITDDKDIEATIQKLHASLEPWRELKEDYWVAWIVFRLGRLYTELSQKEKATEYLELALETFQKIGDKRGESLATHNLGVLYAKFGQHTQALKFFLASLPHREEIGDEIGQASVLTGVGVIHSAMGSPEIALEYYERVLRIVRKVKDREHEANTLSAMASLYIRLGESSRALSTLNQALVLLAQVPDTVVRWRVLNELGAGYSGIGEFQKALEYYQQALALCEKVGDRHCAAGTYSNIGGVYYDLGESQIALGHVQRSLAIFREIGDDFQAALSLSNLGRIYAVLGDERRMLESLKEAFGLLAQKEPEHPEIQVSILLQTGDILRASDNNEAASQAYQRVITLARSIGYKSSEIAALNGVAQLYLETGDKQKGLEILYQAFHAASWAGDVGYAAAVLSSLMTAWQKNGNPQLAIFYGKQAVNRYQLVRTNIRGLDGETQKAYMRTKTNTYFKLAELLLEHRRYAETLEVLNAFQDQQFYDFNHDANARARQVSLGQLEAAFALTHDQRSERVAVLGQRLEDLRRRHSDSQTLEVQQIARIAKELETAIAEFSAAVRQAASDFSRPLRESENISRVEDLAEMQSILRELSAVTGQQTVALYPLIGLKNFRILLVTPESVVTAAAPIDAPEFDRKVLQFHALLQSSSYDPRPLGKDLYDLIVKPVEPALRAAGARTLLWSLNGTLRYVPMASLWDGEHYLVERYQNVVFTRADRARMTRAVNPNWTGVGFGNSRAQSVDLLGDGNRVPFAALPGVSEELRAIFRTDGKSGSVRGDVFIDDTFTKATFLALAKRRDSLVHVASHFSFRPGDDTQSFLLLGDGTALTLNEMKRQERLFEGVELLTLSACDTAALRPDAMGREIDGFAESAQRLGAGAVMATLWTVADNSTPQLMREFYRGRQNGGSVTKAEALRRAQLTLLNGTPNAAAPPSLRAGASAPIRIELVDTLGTGNKRIFRTYGRGAEVIYLEKRDARPFKAERDKPFAHPYYWAPFILIGNGR